MLDYKTLEKNYTNNMKYVRKRFYSLYKKLQNVSIDQYELFEEENGEINILAYGNKLYPPNIEKSISEQVKVFKNNQPVVFQERPVVYTLDNGSVNSAIMLKLQSFSKIIDLDKDMMYFNGYKNIDNNIPALLVFGIGNGFVIQKLIEETNIDHLYLIEYNISILKVSFHLYDWSKIFDYFFDPKRSLMFLEANSKSTIYKSTARITNDLFKYNPMYCFNLTYLTHYGCEEFDELKKLLVENAKRVLEGWGFFDDDLNSLNQSLITYNKNKKILNKQLSKEYAQNMNILIVGNGPSLDNDIETIKKLKNTHLIFSCGTALKSLYINGITPDFHFEIERDINVYDALSSSLNKEYLQTITLIGLNVLHPKVIDLFDNVLIYLRDNDSGSSLLSEHYPRLEHTNPLVANGAFNFAMYLNPKNIYLFGTDMGTVDLTKHHSKSSDYYNDESHLSKAKKTFTDKVKGNFSDTVYTEDLYLWSKQRLQNCIIKMKNTTNIYNCSDGVFVEGTTPLKSQEIKLESTLDKNILKENIESLFTHLSPKELSNLSAVLDTNLMKTRKILKNVENMTAKFKSGDNIARILDSIVQEINDLEFKHQITRSLVSGTLRIMISLIYTHTLAMNKNGMDYNKFIKETFKVIKEFLSIVIKTLEIFKKEQSKPSNDDLRLLLK